MVKKSKTPNQPGFTVNSTQHCNVCSCDIYIGLGGKKNWEVHIAIISHKNAILAKAALPKKNLLSFFTKARASIPTASANCSTAVKVAQAPLGSPLTTPVLILTGPSSSLPTTPPAPSVSEPIPQVSSSQVPPSITTHESDCPLLQELHKAIILLPLTIPLANPSDALAAFAYNPATFLEDGQDTWEEIVLQACISDLKIDAGLFKGKIGRLMEAMTQLTPSPPSEALKQVMSLDPPNDPIIIPLQTPSPACPNPKKL
ncbi:hypothetical protein B0H34DRAFT_799005 [Crassisporium funariophilum]|nr:hypothetical protein B0H34DRAFT_799005 [Crassisporium funariophilum]